MNTPASIQAMTNNASTASTGGSTLLSRRKAFTNPVPRSARRRPIQRNLSPTGRLRGLLRGGRLGYDGRRRLTRGGVRRLEVDVGLYLDVEEGLRGRVQRSDLSFAFGCRRRRTSDGRLRVPRRARRVALGAAISDFGHRHQPCEVT